MKTKNITRVAVRTAVVALAVGGLGLAAAGTASAAPADSYRLHSSPITIGTGIGDRTDISGSCAPGYHVRGSYVDSMAGNFHQFVPTIDLVGGSDMYWADAWGNNHNGGGSDVQDWTYQGLGVRLGNHSWSDTETTTVWWTCDSN